MFQIKLPILFRFSNGPNIWYWIGWPCHMTYHFKTRISSLTNKQTNNVPFPTIQKLDKIVKLVI